jgi:hypothetical protein
VIAAVLVDVSGPALDRARPVLVGEYNPYGDDTRAALYPAPANSAGWRLCHLVLGIELGEYLERFDRRNLVGGPRWSATLAKIAAERLRREAALSGAPLVLLGARVAHAFGVSYRPFTSSTGPAGTTVVVLPHPSGRCRAWNMIGACERARALVVSVTP